ncbi:putative disease resistance protein RGA3 [Vitis vinifera]|uniref:Putative disease resistance protein RGA3 n=1 Tax=Vitis vinifera TaxID=29760 RepID=A0A438CS66_VITVI|nr:putative disease resistance protein RGA3 [Vitis vinifera]
MAVGEIFLSAAFQITLEKLASPMSKELEKSFGDLKKFTWTLSKIQAVLRDAEARQITNAAVKLWLSDVEEVADDAEDVLDEINMRLDEIAKKGDELGLKERSGEKGHNARPNARPPSSSLIDESSVFGREVEKEEILELLVSDEYGGSDVCVIPIVGMGGLGKTTLAQLVYNDEKVTKHFELKMWVCVSDDFDVRRATKSVLDSATGKNFDLMDLDILQSKLRDILKGKRYLLVLDDVWTEKKSDWDRLRLPLRAGATGNDDCWSLFKQIAFENRNADAHPELVRIGEEILKKCRGLPLAVKTIGGLLYLETDEYEWEMILKSDLWDFEEDENGILPALRLSYNHLPEHLKQCFVFCSVFPKDYNFEKETLVLLWIAEGFVLAKGRKHLEDLGSDYFDELLLRSFFQRSKINSSKFFVMHDLVHDLAQYLAGDLCFRLEEGKSQSISERARHAAVLHNTFKSGVTFEALGTTTNLRTVILLHGNERSETPKAIVLHDLLPSLRCLRVLDLSHIAVEEIPDMVGRLKHLRYLNLSSTRIKMLPPSVCTLYNLQSLILMNCNNLKGLPNDMKNLLNLRHLNLTGCWHLICMPPQIGELTCLRTLHRFVVAKEKGCGIGELKGMTELRATLIIDRLEDVSMVSEGREANLKNKQYLRRLELKWSPGHHMPHAIGEELLECLEPHGNLKELKIDVYHGAKFPNWMGYSLLSRLERIELSQCTYSRILPPLGQLPLLKSDSRVSLEKMKLEDMKNLKEWHEIEDVPLISILIEISNFRRLALLPEGLLQHLNSLKELRIQNFYGLEALKKEVGLQDLVSLQRFEILSCPKLVSLPEEGLSSALRYLSLCVCNSLQSLPKGLENLSSLEELSISKCPKLVTFPEEKLPSSLKLLRISACANLVSLPKRLNELSVLQHLAIDSCHALRSLPEEGLPASVRSLSIQRSQLLEKRCEEGGEDWNKIAHIPDRYIERF